MIFQNGSTIEGIQTDNNIVRSSNKVFPFMMRYISERYNGFSKEGANVNHCKFGQHFM